MKQLFKKFTERFNLQIVVHPSTEVKVDICYTPSKFDIHHLNAPAEVFEIGYLKIVMGAEATRWRLKRLAQKDKLLVNKFNEVLSELNTKFSDEAMPCDINKFSESAGAVKDLFLKLNWKIINLTIEQDPDRTVIQGLYKHNSNTLLSYYVNLIIF